MQKFVWTLIYIHAFTGGVSLLSGLTAISAKKGTTIHKKAGTVFSYSLITSCILAIVISRLPKHESLFLLLIGIFTIYMILAGNRSLTFKDKKKVKADWWDKSISGIMFVASLLMIGAGIVGINGQTGGGILYSFFGGFGLLLTLSDFRFFKTFTENRRAWLVNHLSKMIGALIASVTAFIITGLQIGSIYAWVLPSIIGTAYIIFWRIKIGRKAIPKRLSKSLKNQ